jgi:hypothetical protein
MKEMQDRLFNSLMEYWQLIINELVKELEKSYPLGRSTVQEITVGNALPVGKTNTGYKVSLFMPYYYEFMDEGVSGAKFNTGISRFSYKDKGKGKGGRGQKGIPNITAIERFMRNRGIKTFDDIKSKRTYTPTNTKSGKKRNAEQVRKDVAFAIAYNIWKYGLEPSHFYSNVINDKKLQAFEQKLLNDYGSFILDVVKV